MGHNPQPASRSWLRMARLRWTARGSAAANNCARLCPQAPTRHAAGILYALALCLALPSAAVFAAPESIQIVRPLDASREVYLENDDGLLIVPGGRMFLFQVEISALNPILEVRINGRTHSTPRTKWTFIKRTQLLRRGKNRIAVEARTRFGKARQEFVIELRGLPGFGPKADKPAS